jgi:hypothetical protein
MRAETPEQVLEKELDKLRSASRRIEPLDIARAARRAGLLPHEAVSRIQEYWQHGRPRGGELFDGLAIFLSALGESRNTKHIVEFTDGPFVYSARLVEGKRGKAIVCVAPNEHSAEVLRTVFEGATVSIVTSMAEVEKRAGFDAIICAPRLGQPLQRENSADGFGGEIVRQLVPFLAKGGTIYWVTGRGALFTPRARKTRNDLANDGLNVAAIIDVAPGGIPGTAIQGVVLALRAEASVKRFVGALRDIETAESLASALLAGPSKKSGANWTWLDCEDQRTFARVEHARLLEKLTPRGRKTFVPLGSLLMSAGVRKADTPVPNESKMATFLFVPEYSGSRITADLEEQTVKPKAVYRLALDPAKANARFLARLLNGPYGKQLRADAATGTTIQRIPIAALLALELPLPDPATQERIVRIDGDIGLLRAAFRDMQDALDQDWSRLGEVGEDIDRLKSVLDVEQQITHWWRELPYPLATVYRRYQVSQDAKERLDTLVHFFEVAAVYLATVGGSFVKKMRKDWQDVISKWLHPAGAAGIDRADFGFWINFAGASLKDVNRIASDVELRKTAIELAGPELVQIANTIGSLGRATEGLDVARRVRNSWIGHGGHIKPTDAARLEKELQQSVRDLYEITASVFRNFELVRPGMAEVNETGFRFQIEKLSGSDPTFATEVVELDQPAKSKTLAFWMRGTRVMCAALPFFRLGLPQQPQETSFYVFNRVEDGGFRWISYQETREQEFIAPDDELRGIIAMGKGSA